MLCVISKPPVFEKSPATRSEKTTTPDSSCFCASFSISRESGKLATCSKSIRTTPRLVRGLRGRYVRRTRGAYRHAGRLCQVAFDLITFTCASALTRERRAIRHHKSLRGTAGPHAPIVSAARQVGSAGLLGLAPVQRPQSAAGDNPSPQSLPLADPDEVLKTPGLVAARSVDVSGRGGWV